MAMHTHTRTHTGGHPKYKTIKCLHNLTLANHSSGCCAATTFHLTILVKAVQMLCKLISAMVRALLNSDRSDLFNILKALSLADACSFARAFCCMSFHVAGTENMGRP